ncbi:hypothetical protein [Mycolicibacterium llatzerense]|uniref:hypothetical protein n=1 Tax=Mycolicibacterium llatzerense TaxID=280871 RepID=UPI0008DCAE1D|nr:hypothetical protein [Mycolicibacterium llatzerense]
MVLNAYALQTKWYTPLLGVDDLAEILDVKTQSIRQYLSVGGAEGFPEPDGKPNGRNAWSEASVYTYIDNHRPQYRYRIPRLYPIHPDPGPAQFLGSEMVTIDFRIKAALHYWRPGDGRGDIIVAYLNEPTAMPVANTHAQAIAAMRPGVSCVVVPSHGWTTLPRPGDDPLGTPHLAVGVADINPTAPPGLAPLTGRAGQFSWAELANLLRVDVPYWPLGLVDVDAISTWWPGQLQRLAPIVNGAHTGHLMYALRAALANDPELAALLDRARRYINYQRASMDSLIPGTESPTMRIPNRLGLVHAAVADIDPDPPTPLSNNEIATILHTPADERYASDAGLIGYAVGFWDSIFATCARIDKQNMGPLANRWRSRLTEVTDDTKDRSNAEFGYRRALEYIPGYELGELTILADPLNPDCWIVETQTAIHASVGQALWHANPPLKSVEIDDSNGSNIFIEDARGATWLLPVADPNRTYPLGCDGSGVRNLVSALGDLLADLTAPVADVNPYRYVDGKEPDCPLREHLIATQPPLTLTRAELQRLLNPGHTNNSLPQPDPAEDTTRSRARHVLISRLRDMGTPYGRCTMIANTILDDFDFHKVGILDMNYEHPAVQIHSASLAPAGGVDLTITIPGAVARKSLSQWQTPAGLRAIAAATLTSAHTESAPR